VKKLLATAILCLLCVTTFAQDIPENVKATREMKRYMVVNFGYQKIAWYDAIRSLSIQGDTVIVTTDLEEGQPLVQSVCGRISMYVYAPENPFPEVAKIKIFGRDNKVLIYRQKLYDDCAPPPVNRARIYAAENPEKSKEEPTGKIENANDQPSIIVKTSPKKLRNLIVATMAANPVVSLESETEFTLVYSGDLDLKMQDLLSLALFNDLSKPRVILKFTTAGSDESTTLAVEMFLEGKSSTGGITKISMSKETEIRKKNRELLEVIKEHAER
jgi:hypothetical protein